MLKEANLCWYMSLLKFSVLIYHDLKRKIAHHFSANKPRKVSTTRMFNVLQGYSESKFNEDTIKIVNPIQEMFLGVFQNSLKIGHFNESLVQKSTTSVEEIMEIVRCYIKEEINAEKRTREGCGEKSEVSNQGRNQNTIQVREKVAFKPSKATKVFYSTNHEKGAYPPRRLPRICHYGCEGSKAFYHTYAIMVVKPPKHFVVCRRRAIPVPKQFLALLFF